MTPAVKRISEMHSLQSGVDVRPLLVSVFDGASVLALVAAEKVNACNTL